MNFELLKAIVRQIDEDANTGDYRAIIDLLSEVTIEKLESYLEEVNFLEFIKHVICEHIREDIAQQNYSYAEKLLSDIPIEKLRGYLRENKNEKEILE